jgi:hypothetical protein
MKGMDHGSDITLSIFLFLFSHALQENYYWLDRILHSYQSRVYSGDVGTSFEVSIHYFDLLLVFSVSIILNSVCHEDQCLHFGFPQLERNE